MYIFVLMWHIGATDINTRWHNTIATCRVWLSDVAPWGCTWNSLLRLCRSRYSSTPVLRSRSWRPQLLPSHVALADGTPWHLFAYVRHLSCSSPSITTPWSFASSWLRSGISQFVARPLSCYASNYTMILMNHECVLVNVIWVRIFLVYLCVFMFNLVLPRRFALLFLWLGWFNRIPVN
jgi:hypothetical protein